MYIQQNSEKLNINTKYSFFRLKKLNSYNNSMLCRLYIIDWWLLLLILCDGEWQDSVCSSDLWAIKGYADYSNLSIKQYTTFGSTLLI